MKSWLHHLLSREEFAQAIEGVKKALEKALERDGKTYEERLEEAKANQKIRMEEIQANQKIRMDEHKIRMEEIQANQKIQREEMSNKEASASSMVVGFGLCFFLPVVGMGFLVYMALLATGSLDSSSSHNTCNECLDECMTEHMRDQTRIDACGQSCNIKFNERGCRW